MRRRVTAPTRTHQPAGCFASQDPQGAIVRCSTPIGAVLVRPVDIIEGPEPEAESCTVPVRNHNCAVGIRRLGAHGDLHQPAVSAAHDLQWDPLPGPSSGAEERAIAGEQRAQPISTRGREATCQGTSSSPRNPYRVDSAIVVRGAFPRAAVGSGHRERYTDIVLLVRRPHVCPEQGGLCLHQQLCAGAHPHCAETVEVRRRRCYASTFTHTSPCEPVRFLPGIPAPTPLISPLMSSSTEESWGLPCGHDVTGRASGRSGSVQQQHAVENGGGWSAEDAHHDAPLHTAWPAVMPCGR